MKPHNKGWLCLCNSWLFCTLLQSFSLGVILWCCLPSRAACYEAMDIEPLSCCSLGTQFKHSGDPILHEVLSHGMHLLLWAASQVKRIKMYMKRELAQTKHQNHTLTIYFQINWVCFAVCLLQRTVSCCVETMVSLPPITSIESNAVQHWKTITFKGLISSKHGGESLITLFHIYF